MGREDYRRGGDYCGVSYEATKIISQWQRVYSMEPLPKEFFDLETKKNCILFLNQSENGKNNRIPVDLTLINRRFFYNYFFNILYSIIIHLTEPYVLPPYYFVFNFQCSGSWHSPWISHQDTHLWSVKLIMAYAA